MRPRKMTTIQFTIYSFINPRFYFFRQMEKIKIFKNSNTSINDTIEIEMYVYIYIDLDSKIQIDKY